MFILRQNTSATMPVISVFCKQLAKYTVISAFQVTRQDVVKEVGREKEQEDSGNNDNHDESEEKEKKEKGKEDFIQKPIA
ncbi:hypothetical protein PoB_003703700 [Plakobranchus ocellatus]|uniref:Uncharacterized protein n=1 Tax=Plakobranchus ocellatus TaxID=259542 RepID=A0AAV4AUB7_9GAST|nr:hypothetical protein PoB_003703700 [Plakobranchus ocellatus]